jgi:DNA-binding response OmpR family regulator
MPTIAIAEDESDLREAVAEYLGDRGMRVLQAADARAFRVLVEREPIDLAVLDIQMPGEDGLSLARWLRGRSKVGIIFATAADQTVDRILGLEMGADDYITKPYELRELLARIRGILRRIGDVPAQEPTTAEPRREVIAIGTLNLDVTARRLTRQNGVDVKLTSGELDTLIVLAQRPRRVLSRETLAQLLGESGGESGRALDVRIVRIRRKIEDGPMSNHCLRTVRGEGYMFVPVAP